MGHLNLAKAEYHRSAQLAPLESQPFLALGHLQWSQEPVAGSPQQAQTHAQYNFTAAVEVTPGWGQAQVALGNALMALGDRKGAARHYNLASRTDGDVQEGMVYDFTKHLADSEIVSPTPDYVCNDYFDVNGIRRRVLFMHPESRARFQLALPTLPSLGDSAPSAAKAGLAPPAESSAGETGLMLVFDLATDPNSWGLPGDGVTFAVYVESNIGTAQLLSAHNDPKRNDADRLWHSYAVDLSKYEGKQSPSLLRLVPARPATIATTGPAGGRSGCWRHEK